MTGSLAGENRPFFILGAQRSGTTLLRLMLNAHSRMAVPFESNFIPYMYRRIDEFGDLAQEANLRRLLDEIAANRFVKRGQLLPDAEDVVRRRPTTYAEVVDAIFSVLAERQHKVRWGDKTPGYEVALDELWHLFPQALFIHLVRDGRDVALSHRRVSFRSSNLLKAAADWQRRTELAHKMGSMIPQSFLEIRYEDLVRSTETTLRAICNFLGEDFEPPMLEHHERAKEAMPEDALKWHASSVSKVDESKVFEWKTQMSIADRCIFDDIAGSTLELFGYEREKAQAVWATRVRKLSYYLGRA